MIKPRFSNRFHVGDGYIAILPYMDLMGYSIRGQNYKIQRDHIWIYLEYVLGEK